MVRTVIICFALLVAPAIAGAEDEAAQRLVKALYDTDPFVRLHAAAELAQLSTPPPEAAAPLMAALTDHHAMVRFYVARALGRMRGAEEIKRKLLEALGDESWIVRRQAARALGRQQLSPKRFDVRLREIYTPEQLARDYQIELVFYTHRPLKPPGKYALADLHSPRWPLRWLAVRDLAARRDGDAAAAILRLLDDPHPAVAAETELQLRASGEDGTRAMNLYHRNRRSRSPHKLAIDARRVHKDDLFTLALLADMYEFGDANLRRDVLQCFGRVGRKDRFVQRLLSDALIDTERPLQLQAWRIIQQSGLAADIAETVADEALQMNDSAALVRAAEKLQRLGPTGAAVKESLRRHLSSRDPYVRLAAAKALQSMEDDAHLLLPVLENLFDADDVRVRKQAVRAVASAGNAGKPVLRRQLRHERKDVCLQVAEMLIDQGENNAALAGALIELLDTSDASRQQAAAELLGRLGPTAAPALSKLADVALSGKNTAAAKAAFDAIRKIRQKDERK